MNLNKSHISMNKNISMNQSCFAQPYKKISAQVFSSTWSDNLKLKKCYKDGPKVLHNYILLLMKHFGNDC